MLVKQKLNGTVKASGFADGGLQRDCTTKEEVSSDTVSLAMMISCAIYAKINRYVVITDIPGKFLHANLNDTVHMLLEVQEIHVEK